MKITKISDFIKTVFTLFYINLTAIVFLAGLIVLNVAIYLEFTLFYGLITTALSLMFIGWLVNYESEKLERR